MWRRRPGRDVNLAVDDLADHIRGQSAKGVIEVAGAIGSVGHAAIVS
jgi:hypothetical protein